MESVLQQVATAWLRMSVWEVVAFVLAIAYLLLAVRQSHWCWYCAFASTAIYTVLFWDVQLLMESALNVYYMAMAVYGWWQWRGGQRRLELPVQTWGWRQHLGTIGLIISTTLIFGTLLSRYTHAAWPYLDTFTTFAAVVTTFMVARKILENWFYWMIINSVSMVIFVDRGLYLTALLMASYLIISILGSISWYRDYKAQSLHV